MSLSSRLQSFVGRKMKEAFPAEITYTRDGVTIPLIATVGQTRFASQMEGKARVEFGEIDLIIESKDLVFDGAVTTPLKGDRIAITLNGTAMTLELMIPQTREPSWRYSDPERKRIRLHLKRVA